MSGSATLAQVHYRFRTDAGAVDATPTWGAAEDTTYAVAVETTFRLRFVVQNTGTAPATGPWTLRVSKNGGAYTAVTTSTGATLGAQSADASSDADNTTLFTYRLTAGAGSPQGSGIYDETGATAAASFNFGLYFEFEYGLILKTAGAAAGNTFDFRLYNSTTAFTTYTVTPRLTVSTNEKNLLANDVLSASSVTKPSQLKQEHALLANDVKSPSSVSTPAMVQRRDLLANDVTSASSVSQPAVTVFAQTVLLANDVLSGSSVSQPAVQQRQGLLANDVKSNSSVGQPAVKALHGLLANDVLSASSVGQPAVHQSHGILANDVSSGSSVSQPNADEIVPEAGVDNLFANDVLSASSVTSPAVHQGQVLAAVNVVSASSVTTPAAGEIAGSVEQALLANDVISGSSVSQPMLDRPEVVIPPQPELPAGGGGGGVFGKAWQRQFDQRRAREEGLTLREYLKRVEVVPLPRKKDRAAIEKASRAVREALGRAETFGAAADSGLLAKRLGEAAGAAAEANRRAMVRQMQLAEQAALEFLQRLAEAVQRRVQDEDDAFAMMLLDVTGSAETESPMFSANDDDAAFLLLMSA